MKLEPTEAQRKAMAAALPDLIVERDAREDLLEWPEIVDEMIAAANSIPEGAPVGTIARRPDGGWVARRTVGLDAPFWEYFRLNPNAPALRNLYDADSWPQIRPDQRPDQSGLDWFPPGEEPIVPRPDPTAQQEPAYTVAAASEEMAKHWDNSIVTTTKREPRVVDRLGVDEQGTRWERMASGVEYWFADQRWHDNFSGGSDYLVGYEPQHGPYREILEPRVLPSLDCEEARDGTEWKFRLNGEPRSLVYRNNGWRYGEVGDRIGGRCGVSDGHAFIREFAPYIEVVGDPS